jgi:hypothetical protein
MEIIGLSNFAFPPFMYYSQILEILKPNSDHTVNCIFVFFTISETTSKLGHYCSLTNLFYDIHMNIAKILKPG